MYIFFECPIDFLQLLTKRHFCTINGFRVTTIWKRQFLWNAKIHTPFIKISRESDWPLHRSKTYGSPYWSHVQSFIQIGEGRVWWSAKHFWNCSIYFPILLQWASYGLSFPLFINFVNEPHWFAELNNPSCLPSSSLLSYFSRREALFTVAVCLDKQTYVASWARNPLRAVRIMIQYKELDCIE